MNKDELPRPRVCAVCLQSPCACPDFADESDEQAAQEEADFLESLQRALDAAECVA